MRKHVRQGKRLRAKLRSPSITLTTPKPNEVDVMFTVGVDFGVIDESDTQDVIKRDATLGVADALRQMSRKEPGHG